MIQTNQPQHIGWIKENKFNKTAICTDSLSLLLDLEHNNPETSNLRWQLEYLSCIVDLLALIMDDFAKIVRIRAVQIRADKI